MVQIQVTENVETKLPTGQAHQYTPVVDADHDKAKDDTKRVSGWTTTKLINVLPTDNSNVTTTMDVQKETSTLEVWMHLCNIYNQ